MYFACFTMQFTGEPLAGAPAFYRFSGNPTVSDQSEDASPVYRLYRSRDAAQDQVRWWRSSRSSGGGSRQHRRGRRAGRRHQQRRAGRPDQSPRPPPDYERVLIQLPLCRDRETTQITGHLSGGPGGLEIGTDRLRHGDVTEPSTPRRPSGRDNSHPEKHRVPAPLPSERACDAGEGISVRVERRPGPWRYGVRTPCLAEYGGDTRCLARPTRLTEHQTLQTRAAGAAPATPTAATVQLAVNDVTSERRHSRVTTDQDSTADAAAVIPVRADRRSGVAGRGESPADPARVAPAPPRCLARPPRLTERQTLSRTAGGPGGGGAATSAGATRGASLKLGHLNIRSLPPKLDDTRMILQHHSIDILCLSETWLTTDISSDILIFPGYKVFRRDRTLPKRGRKTARGGGLAVLAREELSVTTMSVTAPTASRIETMWLMVSASGGRSAVIGAIYRPPDGRLSDDLDSLRSQLLEALGTGRPVFLLGDVNVDLLRLERPDTAQYSTLLTELSLIQLVQL